MRDPGLYDYLPYQNRPQIRWPGGARVAFWVAPNVEFYELDPPRNPARNPPHNPPQPPQPQPPQRLRLPMQALSQRRSARVSHRRRSTSKCTLWSPGDSRWTSGTCGRTTSASVR